MTIALTDWLTPVVSEGNSFPLDVGVGVSVDEFNRLTIVASSLARCADGLGGDEVGKNGHGIWVARACRPARHGVSSLQYFE